MDHALHASQLRRAVVENAAFEAAVQVALDSLDLAWNARSHPTRACYGVFRATQPQIHLQSGAGGSREGVVKLQVRGSFTYSAPLIPRTQRALTPETIHFV